jgi:hypothetical protein
MALIANTEMAPTKMDLIVSMVQKELKFQAKLAQFFYDASQFAVKGNKSVSFPKLASFVASTRASGVAGVEQVIASTAEKLDLNQNKQVLWVIDPSDEIQSTLNWELETVKRASSAHARAFDTYLKTIALASAELTPTAGVISRNIVLEMIEYLGVNEANMDQVNLFIGPDSKTEMLKISEFTNAQIYGGAIIPNGQIGSVYGVPVVVHNGLASGEFFMADKDGLAYAFQKLPAYDEQKAIEYGAGCMKRTIDQLFGAKSLQIDEGTASSGKSALIIRNS